MIIIIEDCEDLITEVKHTLQTEFDMKDLGPLHYFLGLEIKYLKNSMFLSQHKYAEVLLHKSGMDDCNTHLTPSQASFKLLIDAGTHISASDTAYFRSLVGYLQYLTFTRPDIAYSVNIVCQFLHSPTYVHLNTTKWILRYIKGTLDFSLVFRRGVIKDFSHTN